MADSRNEASQNKSQDRKRDQQEKIRGIKREEELWTSTIPAREPSSIDSTPGTLQRDPNVTSRESAESPQNTLVGGETDESAQDSIVRDGKIISGPPGAKFSEAPSRINRYEPPEALLPPTPRVVAEYWKIIEASDYKRFFRFFLVQDYIDPLPNLGPTLQMTNERGQNFLHVIAATTGDQQFLQTLNSSNSVLAACGYKNGHRPPSIERLAEELPLQQDVDGNTPLHVAASRDDLAFVEGLIQYHMAFRPSLVNMDPKWLEQPRYEFSMFRWQSGRNCKLRAFLDVKNSAGRTAAEDAAHAGAKVTAGWLKRFSDICNDVIPDRGS